MAIINQGTKELQVKIVYYGPARGGKTTNLEQIHSNLSNTADKGKLVSLATNNDRTLFFDFLPIEAMAIRGFKTKFQLYTVPGQVIYNTTRQLVLRGVDGIVFVADSQYDKMAENLASFQNLEENLKAAGLSERAKVLPGNALSDLSWIAFRSGVAHFELIFLGPPYKDEDKRALAYSAPALEKVAQSGLLAPGGLVISQHHVKEAVACPAGLELSRRVKYGDSFVSFYRAAPR